MRILVAHNRYQQKGGEDFVVENETRLLSSKGHDVHLFDADNDHIHSLASRLRAAADCVYSTDAKRKMTDAIAAFKPDIVHFHNIFPTLSSSVLSACRSSNVPFVRTIHNFRLVCPKAILFREGKICEDCVGKPFAWPGVRHACYRESGPGTFVVALATLADRRRMDASDWKNHYIGLADFGKQKLIAGKLPNAIYHIKPNFLFQDDGPGKGDGGYFVFVGRLVNEKGVETLLAAWKSSCAHLKLKIVGTGPLESLCKEAAAQNSNIEFLGHLTRSGTQAIIKGAIAMIFPSVWYEGFPMSIIEALSAGTPVVSSKIGSMAETIQHGETGLHFVPGDPKALSHQILFLASDSRLQARMRTAARADFLKKYTADINYERLMEIYREVIESK